LVSELDITNGVGVSVVADEAVGDEVITGDELGISLDGVDVVTLGKSDFAELSWLLVVGSSLGKSLGYKELEGLKLGPMLGVSDEAVLGISEGMADSVGDNDGTNDGSWESEGSWLGNPDGWSDGTLEGWLDGAWETEGV
jgi:hypothetical protein